MKTGETVLDGQGRTLQVGQILGRGLWASTYDVRDETSGERFVAKVPYSAEDLDQDSRLAETCRTILLEQARFLESASAGAFVRPAGRFALADGTPVMLLHRAGTTLEQRISAGCSFEELIGACIGVVKRLRSLEAPLRFHGNIHPNNIAIDERGHVWLLDPVTPTLQRAMPSLLLRTKPDHPYLSPEVRAAAGEVPLGSAADSYSVGMCLYRGILANTDGVPDRFPDLPLAGLDKARLVALKDRVNGRLKKEHSNPRFHTRMSDRTAALLNRALSRETSPSPPYRFRRLEELQNRLTEILALVHPAITTVGRVIPSDGPGDGFTTDDDVGFTVAVGCTPGVESHEEIACGLAVFDVDTGERLRDVQAAYTIDRHPSGRFKFRFKLSGLGPGLCRIRVAFTVRESGNEPVTSEGEVRVRPAPGYVPPREEPTPRTLSIERTEDPASNTESDLPQPVTASEPTASGLGGGRNTTPIVSLVPPIEVDNDRYSKGPPQPLSPKPSPTLRPSGRTAPPSQPSRRPTPASRPLSAMPPATRAPVGRDPAPMMEAHLGGGNQAASALAVSAEVIEEPSMLEAAPAIVEASPDSLSAVPAAVRHIDPRRRHSATLKSPIPSPPAQPEEPVFAGAGRWSELPLPGDAPPPTRDTPRHAAPVFSSTAMADEDVSPFRSVTEDWIERGMEIARRDPVVVFIVIASALAVGLAGILFTIS